VNLKKLERHLRINLLGPGPHLIKKNLPDRGLTKVEKYWTTQRRIRDFGPPKYFLLPETVGTPATLKQDGSLERMAIDHQTGILFLGGAFCPFPPLQINGAVNQKSYPLLTRWSKAKAVCI